MNLILGSGIIGLLAKHILGKDWTLVPFRSSRYYSFDIPLADNFIKYDKDIEDVMSELVSNTSPILYKRPFSFSGELMYQELPFTLDPYLEKIYGDDVPKLAHKLIKTTFSVYQTTCIQVLKTLIKKYREDIDSWTMNYGDVANIDLTKHQINCKISNVQFNRIVSTIPLDSLHNYCGLQFVLKSRPIVYYWISSRKVDLEGASAALVCDREIEFFKCYKLHKPNHYIFCTFEPLEDALSYFGNILGYDLDIIEAKRIPDALPLGEAPDLSSLENLGITCVGSNAQWDDFMDVSSCIKRLVKLSNSWS